MRLIDANALKEQIENFNCKDCNHYNFVRCRACQIDDALSYIDDAPTVSEWISVKDKLPEKGGYYLVAIERSVSPPKVSVHRYNAHEDYWSGAEVGSRIVNITHWMPLPEPPKEVKQDAGP